MRELSLNILDIAQNSVRANAKNLDIIVTADSIYDWLTIKIDDDGDGMSEEFANRVFDPFTTTRTTRKAGMGLPLFKTACECTGGQLILQTQIGKGTSITATQKISHIDRMPLGDLGATVTTLIMSSPDITLNLTYKIDGTEFFFTTKDVAQTLEGILITEPEVLQLIQEYIASEISILNGGLLI